LAGAALSQVAEKSKRGEKITEKITHNALVNENVQQRNIKMYETIKKKIAELKKPKIKFNITHSPVVVHVDLMLGLIVPDKFHHAHS
jgi:hypothetical protein